MTPMKRTIQLTQDFTIPATDTNPSTETVFIGRDGFTTDAPIEYGPCEALGLCVVDIETDSSVVVEVYDPEDEVWDPILTVTESGNLLDPLILLGASGIRIRGISGGTSGTSTVVLVGRQ